MCVMGGKGLISLGCGDSGKGLLKGLGRGNTRRHFVLLPDLTRVKSGRA